MSKAPFILPEHAAQMQDMDRERQEAEAQQRMAATQLINSIALDIYVRNINPGMQDADLEHVAQFAKAAALHFGMAAGMLSKRPVNDGEAA